MPKRYLEPFLGGVLMVLNEGRLLQMLARAGESNERGAISGSVLIWVLALISVVVGVTGDKPGTDGKFTNFSFAE